MYLKRLELQGFKSFAPKTVFEFPAGIAAVVGPNGSGKSNVIDAVRWILGEREAKNMRSLRAEDLIFAGTPQRPRTGFAQATIVFDNTEKFFAVDFAEVSIRRRIERDGTSKYFMNDAEVRLKDVIDFFAKARLGTKGFSIVNQGDSDLFVRSSPKERRAMLEEILGLREFELKKHESLLKLKSTEVNMDKARTLVEELLPHLRVLRRQAARWEKHDELVGTLRDLESRYFGVKVRELTHEETLIAPRIEALQREEREAEEKLKILEAALGQVEERKPKVAPGGESSERESLLEQKSRIEKELGRREAELEMASRASQGSARGAVLEKLLHETRDTIEHLLDVQDIEEVKEALDSLFRKIDRMLEGEDRDGGDGAVDAQGLVASLTEELAVLSRKLREVAKEEAAKTAELVGFGDAFRGAFEAVERQRQAIRRLGEQASKLRFEGERIGLRRAELARRAEEAGRKLSEFAPRSEEMDSAKAERDMLRLRGELAAIGEIDPALLREAGEAETRYQFLSSQLADLERAHGDLTLLVRDLDQKIHTGFREAVSAINGEFDRYFKMMFGGGHAKLVLVKPVAQAPEAEGGQGAESDTGHVEDHGGIEVSVSIPRKRITGLDMLSGGEKTLVSIAVLFALIAVSPPPFLVLDEADAALDEANTRRFASLVKEFSGKTQFLVVTHNRATMEVADILYGITMGDDGASKILSLKLS